MGSGKKRDLLSVSEYVDEIRAGNRYTLSQVITLIESTRPEYRKRGEEVLESCLPYSGRSIRLGISGSPGVGKSTFIEAMGMQLIEAGHQVAVLAVDPSSSRSGGSILGDKTRMGRLSLHESGFVRATAAGKTLGGVAMHTQECILICEAAGYDVIIIETVGVGQSETKARSMVDFFLLLLLPGAGDELQGIKRGIVEMADLLLINKADGPRLEAARKSKQAYRNALQLLAPAPSGWEPVVQLCSALDGSGLEDVWEKVLAYMEHTESNGYFEKNRENQMLNWMEDSLVTYFLSDFEQNESLRLEKEQLRESVVSKEISPFRAARKLMQRFHKNN